MGLFTSFKSSADTARPAGAADASEIVQEARTRARRRLIGAAVLLGVGIIGFPLLFETQPRPIPVDIPIEIPSRESAPPLQSPASRPGAARAQSDADVVASSDASDKAANKAGQAAIVKPVIDEPAEKADKPASTGAGADKPAAVAAVKPPQPKPASAPVLSKPAEVKPAQVKAAEVKPADGRAAETKAAETKASDAKAAAKPVDNATDSGRWVVQIGAFAEVNSAREARMKVEALGLKTYTQVIESPTGRRIRVRVGPYASKAEAEKAAARIKSGGLQTALLLL